MPRKARLDAYGTLHHVMARGIERSSIFRSDKDKTDFLEHLGLFAEELDTYPWSGHSVIMGKKRLPWQDVEYVLQWFGNSRKIYRAFLQKGIKTEADLEGGGLVRSMGGYISQEHHKKPVLADERVLGTGEFVERFLKEKVEQKNLTQLERQHRMDEILHDYCSRTNTTLNEICGGSRVRHLSRIRSEIAHVLHKELGISYAEIARQFGISGVAVLKMMRRQ